MFVFVFVFDFLCLMLIECSGVARRQTSVGAERVWRRGGDLCAQVVFVCFVFLVQDIYWHLAGIVNQLLHCAHYTNILIATISAQN